MLMTIFDKSFIHSISADEAAVFDMHFMTNLTPLFFVEVLADLEKADLETPDARSHLVQTLAGKTPSFRSYPNIPHHQLVLGELAGHPLDLRNVPVVGGGVRVSTDEGLGTVFEDPPEMQAASRWHEGEFGEAEYRAARQWREMLRRAPETFADIEEARSRVTFRDLAAAKRYAERLIDRDGYRLKTLRSLLAVSDFPVDRRPEVIERWKAAGGPPIRQFAPFSTHVMTVDMFRILAMSSGLIDPDKSSNYADIAYLYYLPFCEAFISCDRLHRKCVPLFLGSSQQFVWGHDLRPHLRELAQEYLADPDLERLGLIGIAGRTTFPPDSFIGSIVAAVHPRRLRSADAERQVMSPEAERELVARLKAAAEAPPAGPDADLTQDDMNTTFKRSVPRRRGRFPMMPRDLKG